MTKYKNLSILIGISLLVVPFLAMADDSDSTRAASYSCDDEFGPCIEGARRESDDEPRRLVDEIVVYDDDLDEFRGGDGDLSAFIEPHAPDQEDTAPADEPPQTETQSPIVPRAIAQIGGNVEYPGPQVLEAFGLRGDVERCFPANVDVRPDEVWTVDVVVAYRNEDTASFSDVRVGERFSNHFSDEVQACFLDEVYRSTLPPGPDIGEEVHFEIRFSLLPPDNRCGPHRSSRC